MAHSLQLVDHIKIIDETVFRWLTSQQNRIQLAVFSYDLGNIFERYKADQESLDVPQYQVEFYQLQVSYLKKYIYSILQLYVCIIFEQFLKRKFLLKSVNMFSFFLN